MSAIVSACACCLCLALPCLDLAIFVPPWGVTDAYSFGPGESPALSVHHLLQAPLACLTPP